MSDSKFWSVSYRSIKRSIGIKKIHKGIVGCIVLLIAACGSSVVPDDRWSDYVYKIIIRGCISDPSSTRTQTGFSVKGNPGIYTTLHGVVGCNNIQASTTGSINNKSYENLQIDKVDISNDVAHLISDDMPKTDLYGLVPYNGPDKIRECGSSKTWEPLQYMGFQKNLDSRQIPGGAPCIRSLQSSIRGVGQSFFEALRKRGSPDINAEVLTMNANIQEGLSGSPIVRVKDSEVVGIVIGGLFGTETTPEVWGVEFQPENLKFKDRFESKLNELATSDIPSALTAFFEGKELEQLPIIPTPKSPYFKMVNNQLWSGSFVLETFSIDQNACITIYSKDRVDQDSVKIGERIFDKGEGVKKISFITSTEPGQEEEYSAFCLQLETQNLLELHAYLFERENNKCTNTAIESDDHSEIKDTFQVTIDHNNLPFTGFCKQ